MRSRVTTKRGDTGLTSALSGDRYAKSHPIMECCGKGDALRAHMARCRLAFLDSSEEDREELAEFFLWLTHTTFLIGAQCSDPFDKHPEYRKLDLMPRHLEKLESAQSALEARIDVGRVFIAAASTELAAEVDVLCTVARDFERAIVALKDTAPDFKADPILAFTNRLSDYFFVLARYLEKGNHIAVDYGLLET